jgi:hypothetical protein
MKLEPGSITVNVFGVKHSPAAYAVRDFLQRSVVPFEWIELQSEDRSGDRAPRNPISAPTADNTPVASLDRIVVLSGCISRTQVKKPQMGG